MQLGKNYITSINLKFNAKKTTLITTIESDEFDEAVSNYYKEESIHKVSFTKDMSAEFETSSEPYERIRNYYKSWEIFLQIFISVWIRTYLKIRRSFYINMIH